MKNAKTDVRRPRKKTSEKTENGVKTVTYCINVLCLQ